MSFINDALDVHGYVLKSRDELPSIFENFHKMALNKFDAKKQAFRTDGGKIHVIHLSSLSRSQWD